MHLPYTEPDPWSIEVSITYSGSISPWVQAEAFLITYCLVLLRVQCNCSSTEPWSIPCTAAILRAASCKSFNEKFLALTMVQVSLQMHAVTAEILGAERILAGWVMGCQCFAKLPDLDCGYCTG